jgi:CRISPR-associated protein Csc2
MVEILPTLKEAKEKGLFLPSIPRIPQGRYVHFVMVRETESFPLFQTDGSLNTINVRAGLKDDAVVSRLLIFKRKQSTPERLTGRELLRSCGIITDEEHKANTCIYNAPKGGGACKKCPDCIHYGYAIGEGAEKSKVYVDSAYSISPYDVSHHTFAFNSPYESGVMTSDTGKTKPNFGSQDHVIPQVFFPAIVTLRDPIYEGFLYVLGNILRADRYGAQDSRTGKVHNHLLAIVFANGEIFSNLRFTQAIYDALKEKNQWSEPLNRDRVIAAGLAAYTALMDSEPVAKQKEWKESDLQAMLAEVTALYQDEKRTCDLLTQLNKLTMDYAGRAPAAEETEEEA